MAKKSYRGKATKGKKKKSKGKKKKSPLLSSVKRFLGVVLSGTVLSIALLFLYDYVYPEEAASAFQQIKEENAVRGSSKVITPLDFPKGAEQPRLKTKKKEQILHREGYSVSYNPEYRIPNWVAWVLTKEKAESTKAPRYDKFVPDPDVSEFATAYNEDYKNSGYDRGHMAPAGDMKWSHQAMRESFYFSNICPQNRKMNGGIWNSLEQQCRTWASKKGELLIVTGPVITEDMRYLGKNRVAVPKHLYKVICTVSNNKYQGIAFLLENKEYKNTSLRSVAIPINEVEEVTGIDFFHLLPDDQEREMERSVDLNFWFK